jgi:hypothetical protein
VENKMKIGINLVGVSYHDGKGGGRYRNYQDALVGFYENIVDPLTSEGHEVYFYLYSYKNPLEEQIIKTYKPRKYTFADAVLNIKGGGDRLQNGMRMLAIATYNSLEEILSQDLDAVISTRFDISFNVNPFKILPYDFDKFNFFFREPEYTDVPICCDTFYVFPHSMTQNFMDAILDMESDNSPQNIAMHNMYVPMVNQVGKEKVKIVTDEIYSSLKNPYYKLTRHD